MNFFKKYWIAILIIIVLVISFIIGIFEGLYKTKQEQTSLSNYHEELDNDKQHNHPPRTKREKETPKPKIKITQEKYDKIKSYILSENENEVLSLNDLSEEEKTKIEKIKQDLINNMKDSENGLKSKIDEYQKECDGYNKQINKLDPKKDKNEIEGLNNMLQGAERLKKDLIEGLNRLFTQDKQFALSDFNSLYEITSAKV